MHYNPNVPLSLYLVCVLGFFIFGLLVGSFLNVLIYRLHTGRALGGRSHCLSCGKKLRWFHLFPLLSYLFLKGKCAYCMARISPRYLLVECLTGLLFILALVFIKAPLLVPLYLLLMAAFVVIIVYDILHTIIPDEYVILAAIVAALVGGFDAVTLGSFAALLPRALAALCGFLFFAFLWRISGGRWVGFGDAKLAAPLGFLLSWPAVVSGIIFSFWIGAAVSLTLLLISRFFKRGKRYLPFLPSSLTIKSEVPFAPFLIAGFLFVHFLGLDAFTLVGSLLY